MRVPVLDAPSVAPDVNPNVRVDLQNVGAGSAAIGQGLKQLGGGIDQLGGDVEEYQRRVARAAKAQQDKADRLSAMNAETQASKDWNAAAYGDVTQTPNQAAPGVTGPKPLDPLSAGGGVVASHAAGDLAFADDNDTHEQPTGPSQATVSAVSDGSSGLAPGGYFNARGMNALKYAHPTMDHMEGRIEDIAKGLPSDNARALFRERMGRQVEEWRGQVERHSSQQVEVAQKSALTANMGASFGNIQKAADFFDAAQGEGAIEGAKVIMAPVESNIRALAASPEAGEAQVSAYRQEVMEGLAKRYVDAKDWKSAKAVLDGQADALRYGKDGEGKLAAWQKTVDLGQRKSDADSLTMGLLDDSKEPGGLYNTNKLLSDFMSLPQEKRTPEALEALQHTLQLGGEASRAKASDYYKMMESQYANGGNQLSAIQAPVAQWMKDNDPDAWLKFTEHAALEQKRLAPRPGKVAKEGPTDDQVSTFRQFVQSTTDDPRLVKDMTEAQFRHDFGQGQMAPADTKAAWNHVMQLQGKKPAQAEALPVATQRLIFQQMNEHGLNAKGAQVANSNAGRVYSQVQEGMLNYFTQYMQAHKGEQPPPEKQDEELRRQFQKVRTPGVIYGHNETTRAQLESDPDTTAEVRSKAEIETEPGKWAPLNDYEAFEKQAAKPREPVPVAEQISIRRAYARRGIANPTQEQIRGMYEAGKGQGAAPAAKPSLSSTVAPTRPSLSATVSATPARPSLVAPSSAAILQAAGSPHALPANKARGLVERFGDLMHVMGGPKWLERGDKQPKPDNADGNIKL